MTTKEELVAAQLEAARILRREQSKRAIKIVLGLLALSAILITLQLILTYDYQGDMIAEHRAKTANPPVAPN